MQNKISQRLILIPVLATVLLCAACATNEKSASMYSAQQAQREQTVRFAVVEGVRDVTIDRGSNGTGTAAGAVVGGVAGSTVGGRREGYIAAVLGAVVGGIVGQTVENSANKKPALEITLRYDNGDLRAIVQEIGEQRFVTGERVRVLQSGGVTRVVKG
jgi:outer membrane lipoprotein SlyB